MLWLTVALGGDTLMFQSLGTDSWRDSYDLAGSSLFTLDCAQPAPP